VVTVAVMNAALEEKEYVYRFRVKGGGLHRKGTGLSRIAPGSVPEAVVHGAPCSILVVRLG